MADLASANVGYVVAGYSLTAAALAGYVGYLLWRAGRARRARRALAQATSVATKRAR